MSVRRFKVDFFCAVHKGLKDHPHLDALFDKVNAAGCTQALELEPNSNTKFQLRSVRRFGPGRFVKAVFGRCRFDEPLVQGDEQGNEQDLKLRPGYGLVEKNHLLFVPSRNLLIWERSASGSHHSKFQHYVNELLKHHVLLEPILMPDAYQRLIRGGGIRSFELSITPPGDADLYEDLMSRSAIELAHGCSAITAKINISAGRSGKSLPDWIKQALGEWAKSGRARVARAKLDDLEHPIDLIGSRLVHSASVPVGTNHRVSPEDVFHALDQARNERADQLKRYYGR